MVPEHFPDPVGAYNRLAPRYAQLCLRRKAYLEAVETLILECIPGGSRSLLDLGSGDGKRALRIAQRAGIERLVMLEPAEEMPAQGPGEGELWPIRAEDLKPDALSERFDVITCLWNVLGHIATVEKRQQAVSSAARLLSNRGWLFLDVIHRYNLRTYGVLPTCARWLRDQLAWSDENGDVTAKWLAGTIHTYGHVFTHREMVGLAKAAGLEIEERIVVDYSSGKKHRFACMGNLLYILRHSSPIDSLSAPQTS